MERHLTDDLYRANRHVRSGIENSKFARGLLKTIGVLAVSMVMSDGVLTPAQSVLGAVQGLTVVKADISNSVVVGATCGILILLFMLQPFGTTKLATAFAPIVIIWLAFNASFGVYNLVKFDASVLKAFSPSYAFSKSTIVSQLLTLADQGKCSWRGVKLTGGGCLAVFCSPLPVWRHYLQIWEHSAEELSN